MARGDSEQNLFMQLPMQNEIVIAEGNFKVWSSLKSDGKFPSEEKSLVSHDVK